MSEEFCSLTFFVHSSPQLFVGQQKVDGELFHVSETPENRRPFKALLDVGLRRTTTGARVFGAMKGAADGGLLIPHKETRFPGFKEGKFAPKSLRAHIFGSHVAAYMKHLSETDPEHYKRQFARYIKAGIKPEGLEALYGKVHAAIRANPVAVKVPRPVKPAGKSAKRTARLTTAQRNINLEAKKAKVAKASA